ncbi:MULTISPECIES: hypothetical protein [unclassified Streptomyces]
MDQATTVRDIPTDKVLRGDEIRCRPRTERATSGAPGIGPSGSRRETDV